MRYVDIVKRLSLQLIESDPTLECPVCLNRLQSVDVQTLVPCGHLLCTVCSSRCAACPLCRKGIDKVVAVPRGQRRIQRFRTWGGV